MQRNLHVKTMTYIGMYELTAMLAQDNCGRTRVMYVGGQGAPVWHVNEARMKGGQREFLDQ
jgi:hypothetical protein